MKIEKGDPNCFLCKGRGYNTINFAGDIGPCRKCYRKKEETSMPTKSRREELEDQISSLRKQLDELEKEHLHSLYPISDTIYLHADDEDAYDKATNRYKFAPNTAEHDTARGIGYEVEIDILVFEDGHAEAIAVNGITLTERVPL